MYARISWNLGLKFNILALFLPAYLGAEPVDEEATGRVELLE